MCSVLLCKSVRKSTHPLDEIRPMRLAGEVFSLTERTEFTEPFGARFEHTEGLRHTEFTEHYS